MYIYRACWGRLRVTHSLISFSLEKREMSDKAENDLEDGRKERKRRKEEKSDCRTARDQPRSGYRTKTNG